MLGIRVIPCLLLHGNGLVKTRRFANPTYLGDPINTVRIFNDKEVDELVLLDITATAENRGPNLELLEQIAGECFVPLAYGGGLQTVDQMKSILRLGYEKVVLNSVLLRDSKFDILKQAADAFGSQSVVASIDVKRNWLGKAAVHSRSRVRPAIADPAAFASQLEKHGAGEIFVTSVDRDGCFTGYDVELIRSVTSQVRVPVIACGGAANHDDLASAVRQGGASAASAGSMFVFQGKHRAVLISFPSTDVLEQIFPERRCDNTGDTKLAHAA